jgi:glucose-1-phosphate thymidylyltransferase
MNALILAAGYATRLYPLTANRSKMLLPVGGRSVVDYVLDRIREVQEIEEVHLVTNAKFADSFRDWAPPGVTVHDDGTTSEDDRLGAIGDLRLVLERVGTDHWLVIAGDNLFDYSLRDYVDWWRTKGEASAVAVYEHPDRELVKQYGVVALDDDERILDFVEKPNDPPSNLAATATYLFHSEHAALVARYLDEGNSPDQPGRFVEWLYTRAPVYGYRFRGEWLDIGNREQLLEADNRLRARAGLPARVEYSV